MSSTREDVAAMLGIAWAKKNIKYSFGGSADLPLHYDQRSIRDDFGEGQNRDSVRSLSSAQQAAFRSAAGAWEAVADIQLAETAGKGDIAVRRIPFADPPREQGVPALTISDNTATEKSGADVWLSTRYQVADSHLSPGAIGYYSILHEIGHSLGLHGDKDINGRSYDSRRYTVMSYNGQDFVGVTEARDGLTPATPPTPMLYDIAAIQALYGANPRTNAADNNTYKLEMTGGWPIRAIWDAGGEGDNIDGRGQSRDVRIDLNPGGESYLMNASGTRIMGKPEIQIAFQPQLRAPVPTGGTGNRLIPDPRYATNYIENAFGGSGNDLLLGNPGANRLEGDDGGDNIQSGDGDDVIVGGKDSKPLLGRDPVDRLQGGRGNDTYRYDKGDGQDIITDVEGTNVLEVNGVVVNGRSLLGSSETAPMMWKGSIQGEELTFSFFGDSLDVPGDLVIYGAALGPEGRITIQSFTNGQFGITLPKPQQALSDTTPNPNRSTGDAALDELLQNVDDPNALTRFAQSAYAKDFRDEGERLLEASLAEAASQVNGELEQEPRPAMRLG
jgi:hypothetical protein